MEHKMAEISKSIQSVFEELIKLLLRKTLHGSLNKSAKTTVTSAHVFNQKDSVHKYTYHMTKHSLGWDNQMLANIKIFSKQCKNATGKNNGKTNQSTAKFIPSYVHYTDLANTMSVQDLTNRIANNRLLFYTVDLPYIHCFRKLELLGKNIIYQTQPSRNMHCRAKMITARLSMRLQQLEKLLTHLLVNDPSMYDAYIGMVHLINSLHKSKISWMIALTAILMDDCWESVTDGVKNLYYLQLGKDFVQHYLHNPWIVMLIRSKNAKLILTASLLYPLLKMLFIVFGYSKWVPIVETKTTNETRVDSFCAKNESPSIFHDAYQTIYWFNNLYPTITGLMGGLSFVEPQTTPIKHLDIPPNYHHLNTLADYLCRFNDYAYCQHLSALQSKKQPFNSKNKTIHRLKHLMVV